jgi:hypothetical protein
LDATTKPIGHVMTKRYLAAWMIGYCAITGFDQGPGSGRTLISGRPIEPQLIAGEPLVIVEKVTTGGLVVERGQPATFAERIATMAACDNLAVIDSVKADARLSENGTWVQTRLTARAIEVVKGTDMPLTDGRALEFAHDGGQLILRGTVVRAGFSPSWDADRKYLLCLSHNHLLNAWTPGEMFEVDGRDTLTPMRMTNGRTIRDDDALIGQDIRKVIAAIRQKGR